MPKLTDKAKSLAKTASRPYPSIPKEGYTPHTYKALRNEVGVFTTPPYSGDIKGFWKFKDEDAAKLSSEEIWEKYLEYKKKSDFVGMDISRKFIQMGKTRSLRYALRKGGRKYDETTGNEVKRTGEVYDEEKKKGAEVFDRVLARIWEDEVYVEMFEGWKEGRIVGKAGRGSDGSGSGDRGDRGDSLSGKDTDDKEPSAGASE